MGGGVNLAAKVLASSIPSGTRKDVQIVGRLCQTPLLAEAFHRNALQWGPRPDEQTQHNTRRQPAEVRRHADLRR